MAIGLCTRRKGASRSSSPGFCAGGKVVGRPADVLRWWEDTLLVTDDHAGVIDSLRKR
jgi:hypothetical protein